MKWLALTLVSLLLLLQYDLWIGDGSLPSAWRLSLAIEAQQAENDKLRELNDALEAEVNDLNGGLEAIEERARTELGMVRKEETFFHIVEE